MKDFLSPSIKKIEEIKKYGISAQGRREYIDILQGRRVTYKKRSLAYCYDCQGYYSDGRHDCGNSLCPLYAIMPYRHSISDNATEKSGGK